MKKNKPGKTESRGRPLSFNKQEALNKALLLFWKKGFESTSIHDLTAAMEITPPSLYAAFGNKEQLFWAAVDLYLEKYAVSISKTLAENDNAKEAIHHLLKKLALAYTKNQTPHGCLIVCATNNNLENSTHVDRTLRKMRRASEEVLVNKIKSAMQLKQIPATTNAESLGKFFAALIQGMSIQSQDGVQKKELTAIVDLAMQAWPESSDA